MCFRKSQRCAAGPCCSADIFTQLPTLRKRGQSHRRTGAPQTAVATREQQMGKKAKLTHEAVIISRRCGGSRRHQKQRYQLITSLLEFLQANHRLPDRIRDIEADLVREYFRSRLASGDEPGHLHNVSSRNNHAPFVTMRK